MPRPRARQCDECAHYEPNAEGVCELGHAPRFYMPTERTVLNQQWGYKRRCQDYVPGAGQPGREVAA